MGLILKRILFFIVFGTIFSFGAVFSIDDTSANEGSTETFTVTISGPCRQGVTYYVDYATSSGTATSGTDFTAKTGTITYTHTAATVNSGQCGTKTFTVLTTNDAGYESDETFNVTLSNARSSNNATYPASIGDGSAIGTILNNDTPPVFSIANVSTTEGNSGTKNLNFTLTLTGTCAANEVYKVNYTTSDGTATAGSDYTATSNTATFTRTTNGTCGTQTISVPIIGDTDYESDEAFSLTLSSPSNATLSPGSYIAVGTITNDDTPPPVFSIANVSTTEGNSGTTNLGFTLTLTGTCVANKVYTVDYATSDGTATAGSDYTATSNTATFTRTTTGACGTQTINVPIIGETVFETDEAFSLTLSNPSNATLSPGSYIAVGTITNDDVDYGYVDFTLINPSDTRNMIGNYAIAGNTVECITTSNSAFGGTCTNDFNYNDNNYMSKYIDIDSNGGTWNSTSSSIVLPNTYDETGGIAWAGLFWQGNVNNYDDYSTNNQRRATPNGSSAFNYTNITSSTNVNVKTTNANKILLKIDNETSYVELSADKFHYDKVYGPWGSTYAAFKDITTHLKSYALSKGTHTFTVANITTNEGREQSLGDYGGWSLVVIYKENALGKARNISIYDGFTPVENGKNQNITISGFKLPSSGAVSSQFTSFAGEGEAAYSPDKMTLNGSNMPGAIDTNNIFDARVAGITRSSANPLNAVENTNGIDIDRYDTSTIMTALRNSNANANSVNLSLTSSGDYYTPSMIAFSAELYRPNLCYDFEATQGDYVAVPIASDRSFTPINNGDPFNLKLFVRSQESDFPINGANLGVDFNRSGILQFNLSKTEVQPPHVNAYEQAILMDGTAKNISIGSNNSITGGTIGAFESIYAKINHNMITGTNLPMKFDATINGSVVIDASTIIPFSLSTSDGSLNRCKGSAIYNPRWLQFNIERPNTSNDYRLYTQVTGKPFAMDVVSYSASSNYKTHQNLSNVVTELELIDVGSMDNNASMGYDTVCEDVGKVRPWLNNKKVFQIFNGSYRANVNIPSQLNTYAIKNAAMRAWVLTDGNGTIVHHTCTDVDHSCFKTLYTTEYSSFSPNNCGTSCGSSNTDRECYECLKTYYATPACSRDNFSVRPDGFRIRVGDNNQTTNSVSNWIIANQNNPSKVNLVSGYNYPIEINATRYKTSEIAQGYYQTNDDENDILNGNFSLLKITADLLALIFDDDTSACNDTKHVQLKVDILNGINNPTNSYIHRENVGKFNLAMIDNTWTQVDQAGYAYKPFTGSDCVSGNGDSDTAMVGCSTLSDKGTSDFSTVPINFVPAKIAVNMSSSSPLNLGWLYMGDINESMSVKFDGNLTAVNYKNVATSNFVNGCAAKDVNLSMDFNNSPSSMVAKNLADSNTTTVKLKYGFKSNNDANYTYGDANASGFMQIKKSKFLKDNNGSSPTEILYNIEKILDKVLNPIKIWFKTLTSILADDDDKNVTAYVETKNNFTIEGNQTYNQSYIFLYGRVYSPLEGNTPKVLDLSTQTKLSVLAYCDVGCAQYNTILNMANMPDTNWYIVKAHEPNYMGLIERFDANETGTSISPNKAKFVNSGTTDPVTIAYPMALRSKKVKITVYPTSWLKYSADGSGNPSFYIQFVAPSYEWFGVGKTGDVVNTKPVPKNNRLSW
jgi:hypothetical protein